jgi:hypothetical protein
MFSSEEGNQSNEDANQAIAEEPLPQQTPTERRRNGQGGGRFTDLIETGLRNYEPTRLSDDLW